MFPAAKSNRLKGRFTIFLFLLAGQAHAGLFSDDEARQKIDAQQQEIQKLQSRLDDVESRLKKLEAAQIDMASQYQNQGADSAALRGRMEEMQHAIDDAQKRQKDFYIDLDTRLRKLEPQAGGAAPASAPSAAPPSAAAPSAPVAAAPVPAAPAPSGQADYEAAFNQFKIGNYNGAIAGFTAFIKAHPDSSFAASAQYWIGNAYFAMRNFDNAIEAQRKLISKYPDSQKAPDALINIASSQQELGHNKDARKTLESVIATYPASDAAAKAKRRLEESGKR